MKVTILDGYIDEPSRLGVPPFISPYPRYVAGATIAAGHEAEYMTVDQWRRGMRPPGDLLFIISGALVPGKYLRTMPMSGKELATILDFWPGEVRVWHPSKPPEALPGPGGVHIWGCDPDAYAYGMLTGKAERRRRTIEEWASWPVLGAGTVRAHDDFSGPLIAEIDMSYGCPHYISGGCSFCTEPLMGRPVYRDAGDIIAEVKALLSAGCVNFRLGGQSCTFSYKALGVGDTDRPRPNVKALGELFKGISGLPGIEVLHTDNADPGIMATYPEESERILGMIVGACTSGNILSLGLESADPAVAEKNNLNSTAEEAMAAIAMINDAGRERGQTGLPMLLPGLNFLGGLEAETPGTFAHNRKFLEDVLGRGHLLRRINIRQVSPARRAFPRQGTKKDFIRFKEFVRGDIDPVMLRAVVPAGTLLRGVHTEVRIGKIMFGRQPGTYPILVGIPQDLAPGMFLDVKVTGHGSRSITAVGYPLDVNNCQLSALEALPGIGRKRAIRLFRARPMETAADLAAALEDNAVFQGVKDYFGDAFE